MKINFIICRSSLFGQRRSILIKIYFLKIRIFNFLLTLMSIALSFSLLDNGLIHNKMKHMELCDLSMSL